MTNTAKVFVFRALGLILSTLPPLFATLSYFPIWRTRGAGALISGLSLLLILLCAVPSVRAIKTALRSPSAPIVWFVVFVIFFALSKIADEVTVIAFVGFISNLIGAIFFSLARKRAGEEKQ